jgi:aldose 1-epimerase
VALPPTDVLGDASACRLGAGDLEAVFLPGRGMLGASLRHRGEELLGRVEDLAAAAEKGSTAGIPFLYPWANRLGAARYRCAGREVELDTSSPLLHLDEHGLPIHGVPWARLPWEVTATSENTLNARLDWTKQELLSVFPFRHHVELVVHLVPAGLWVQTSVLASAGDPVPVSFGFHPYFALPGQARKEWQLTLPTMRRFVLDARGIPTGEETAFLGFDGPLGQVAFDDGFGLASGAGALSVTGRDRRLTLQLLSGYGYAQVFAPNDKAFIALEPMTAPTGALSEGRGLTVLKPGGKYVAAFRVRVDWLGRKGI